MTTETSSRPIAVGDRITHPDFTGARPVLELRPCEVGAAVTPHMAYVVDDAPWGQTWVCSRDGGAARA